MSLTSRLESTMLEDLKHADLNMFQFYAWDNKDIISLFYNQGIIKDKAIESALEEAIIKNAKDSFMAMTAKHRLHPLYADHLMKPEVLAYALSKDVFSQRDILKIPFDHGDTAVSFVKQYHKNNLPAILREELLHPQPIVVYAEGSHCCEQH